MKGYAAHERSVLEEVTQLRAAARALPEGDVAARAQAEGALSAALGRLFALAENYPDLKASGNFLALQQQLSDLENELQMARRYYNGTVRNLNVLVQSFPNNLVAGLFGFGTREFFQLGERRGRRAAGRSGVRPAMSTVVRQILAGALTSLALLAADTLPGVAAEVIHTFDSSVTVARDGELTVSETIRVRAEHRSIRHGIYRDFPLYFRGPAGNLHEVTFSVLGLTRDGHPEPYHTARMHNFVRIYAGSSKTNVPVGDHTYVLRYRTGRQLRWFDGKPELNWNVTGNFWNFPILAARYHLHLADQQPPPRWTAYTGWLGARGTDWQGAIGADGTLTVATTRAIRPGEGLTVVAELPASAVDAPSASTLLWYQLYDERRWIFAALGFLLVLGFYVTAWSAVGRDPKGGTIIPLFHPPAGISPALANYIRDWGFGREKWRAFTAAALSLAVRGLVRFNQDGKKLTLKSTVTKLEGGFSSLPPGERAILSWVNEMGAATIDKAHGERVAKVGEAFTKNIEARKPQPLLPP